MGASKKLMSKLGAAAMSAVVAFSLIPEITGNDAVFAASTKNQSNTSLCVSQIANPVKPANKEAAWSGSYVYLGNYNNKPIKFRVLDANATGYGSSTMLLESDECLFKYFMDTSSSVWNSTSLKYYLGNNYKSYFDKVTLTAIYSSTYSSGKSYASGSYLNYAYTGSVSMSYNYLFVLEAGDLANENYGYSSDPGAYIGTDSWKDSYTTGKVGNRVKTYNGTAIDYWVRNKSNEKSNNYGCVSADGHFGYKARTAEIGVAPALNVNKSKVVLSTLVSGTSGKQGAEYKLTVVDDSITASIQNETMVTVDSNMKVTIPYYIGGSDREDVNRVSVLILDKEYRSGNTNDAKILYYDQLGGTYAKKGTGTFTLPSSLSLNNWNSSYYVYIIAEDINGDKDTDKCSQPLRIYDAPTKVNMWYERNNKWSYYNQNGMKVTGWNKIDGSYYYFNNQGYMLKDWRQIDGNWYFLGGNGILRTEWQQIGSNWYYFGGNGVLRTGWQQINGYWFYFGDSGVMRIGWQQIGGSWYYFDSKGHLLKGWQQIGNNWYYLGDSGVMRIGWQKIGGNWYYFNSKGQMLKEWQQISGKWYYFGASGIMRTGWQKIGGNYYYFTASSGEMLKGWQQISGKWYYLGDSGVMRIGWQQIGGYWYYFESSGSMVTGSKKIGNKTYKFDSNGRCTNP